FPRFFGTAGVLGSAAVFMLYPDYRYAIGLAAFLLVKLGRETRSFQTLDDDDAELTPDWQSARLMVGPLRPITALRYVTAFALLFLLGASTAFASPLTLRISILVLAILSEGT